MFCFPLTNWTTMRGGQTVLTITQSESQWLDLQGFEDIVAWLECRNVTPNGATNITIAYQTAPTKDESLFTDVPTALSTVPLTVGTPIVTKVLMRAANVPLARWLRWQLAPSGGALAGSWDATFRVWIAANIGPHPLRPRINAPSLRPNGKSCNGDCSKGGSRPSAGMTIQDRVNRQRAQAGQPSMSMAGHAPTNATPSNGSGQPGMFPRP